MRGGRWWVGGVLALVLSACVEPPDKPSAPPDEGSAFPIPVPGNGAVEPPSSGEPAPPLPTTPKPVPGPVPRVPPARNVTFTPSVGGGVLGWEPPEASASPVRQWEIRVGTRVFYVPGTSRSLPIFLTWPAVETLELIALYGEDERSEPVVLRDVRSTEPVQMRAWALTGGDGERRIQVYLWRSEPVTVELQSLLPASNQPASLNALPRYPFTVGPRPVRFELTWNVGRDCRGDQAHLRLSARVGSEQYGSADAIAWLTDCAATGQTQFLRTGEWPSAVRAADVDGDGRRELLVAHEGSPSLLVLFPNPEGGGYRRRYVYVGRTSSWMFVRDINGDGRADVLLAQEGSAELLVLLGDARRLLAPAQGYDLGAPATAVGFADTDGDGSFDVIALERLAGRYSIFGGQPDGSFVKRASGPAPEGATGLLLGDVSGDGRVDLAFPPTRVVSVDEGKGRVSTRALPATASGFKLEAADVDGNGVNELLGLETLPPEGRVRVHVFEPDGAGTLSARPVVTTSDAVQGSGVRLADLDGDGLRDFVFLRGGSDGAAVCFQNGGGACVVHEVSLGYCQSARDGELASLDGDSAPELVFAVAPGCSMPGYISVNRWSGRTPATSFVRIENRVAGVVFVDANGDGRRDVVVGAHDVTLLGLEGTWASEAHVDVGGAVRALASGDFTGDGRTDVAALNERGQVFLLTGVAGGFERSASPLTTLASAQRTSLEWHARMASGDFNRDGRDDLLVTSQQLGVTLLTSSESGFHASRPFLRDAHTAFVADLDLDGWRDVILVGFSGRSSHLARADGTFQAVWEDTSNLGGHVFAHDLTRDGLVDLVVGNTLHEGQRWGRFLSRGALFQEPYGHSIVAAGDWNGDGWVDAAVSEWHGLGSGSTALLLDAGGLAFKTLSQGLTPVAVKEAWAADLEGDAGDELLLATSTAYESSDFWRLELFRPSRPPPLAP